MGWGVPRILCLITFLLILCAPADGSDVGIVYGYDANNLPLPSVVVQLLNMNTITQVRIYDTNPEILKAFMGSNIELIVGINNTDLVTVGQTNASALAWVTANIVPFITSVNITGIAVGDEVMSSTYQGYSPFLAQAMIWIRNALANINLSDRIVVSTPFSTGLLLSYFPPSQAIFNQSLTSSIRQVLQFLNSTGVPLYLNVNSYAAFQASSAAVSLPYALFQPVPPQVDTYTSLSYFSLFDALVDSTYAAMAAMGYPDVQILVTATGWPSLGDSNENGASPSNAQTYNDNLVLKIRNGSGTPAKANPLSAYVYELFNENLKPGATSERNYGLFQYNLVPVYSVDLTGENKTLTANTTEYRTWCVAVSTADPKALLSALNWACGQGGVNCSAISLGGPCYNPDTLLSHCSWAFNNYYQKNGNAPGTCSFNGVAYVVSFDPSYGSCQFIASNITSTVGGGNGAIPPTTSPNTSAQGVQYPSAGGICFLAIIFVLNFRYLFK